MKFTIASLLIIKTILAQDTTSMHNSTVMETSSVVMESSTMVMESSTTTMDSSTMVMDSSTMVMDSSSVVMDSSSVVIESSTMVMESSSVVMDSSTMVMESSSVVMDSSTMVTSPSITESMVTLPSVTETTTFDSNNYDCFTDVINIYVTVTLVENEQTIVVVSPTVTTTYYSAPKPTVTSLGDGDLEILNYALTLEYLELEFYRQGLANYSSSDLNGETNYSELRRIANHEDVHVQTLIKVINATYPNKYVAPCKYDFGVSNVSDFLSVARALERTGVSAYLGRVAEISNKNYLVAAATIVTVEARHSSFLNTLTGYASAPEPFDTPLPPKVIVTIASQFITSCPFDLGVTPLERLTVTTYNNNSTVRVNEKYNGMYCNFVYGANSVWVMVNNTTCYRPNVNNTDIYLFITKTSSDSDYLAGPVILSEKSATGSGYTDGQNNTQDNNTQNNNSQSSSQSVFTMSSLLLIPALFIIVM